MDNQQAELEGIRYSVKSGESFIAILLVQSNGSVVNLPNIPASYSGRVRMEGRASLVIKDINLQDNTEFMCTLIAKLGAGKDVFDTVQLIVTGMYQSFLLIALIHLCTIYPPGVQTEIM